MLIFLAQTLINGDNVTYTKDGKYPSIHRDLAILHNNSKAWDELREEMYSRNAMVYYNPADDSYKVEIFGEKTD